MSPTQSKTPYADDMQSDDHYSGPAIAPFEGVIGVEGLLTGDGRLIQEAALSWATFPLPLRWAPADFGGHDGAVIVGRIDKVERRDNGDVYAWGVLDLGSKEGRECGRLMRGQFLSGVSMDLDDVDSFEAEVQALSADGAPIEDGIGNVLVTKEARVRAATLVAIPAFDEARLSLIASLGDPNKQVALGRGTFSLSFTTAAAQRVAFRAGEKLEKARAAQLRATLETFAPRTRALREMRSTVEALAGPLPSTFAYNPLQWRIPKHSPGDKDGQWIDMPGTAFKKFFDSAPADFKIDPKVKSNLTKAAEAIDRSVQSGDIDGAQAGAAELHKDIEEAVSLGAIAEPDNVTEVLDLIMTANAFDTGDTDAVDTGDLEGSNFDDPEAESIGNALREGSANAKAPGADDNASASDTYPEAAKAGADVAAGELNAGETGPVYVDSYSDLIEMVDPELWDRLGADMSPEDDARSDAIIEGYQDFWKAQQGGGTSDGPGLDLDGGDVVTGVDVDGESFEATILIPDDEGPGAHKAQLKGSNSYIVVLDDEIQTVNGTDRDALTTPEAEIDPMERPYDWRKENGYLNDFEKDGVVNGTNVTIGDDAALRDAGYVPDMDDPNVYYNEDGTDTITAISLDRVNRTVDSGMTTAGVDSFDYPSVKDALNGTNLIGPGENSPNAPTVPETGGTVPEGQEPPTRQVSGSDQALEGDLSDVAGGELLARYAKILDELDPKGLDPKLRKELAGITKELDERGLAAVASDGGAGGSMDAPADPQWPDGYLDDSGDVRDDVAAFIHEGTKDLRYIEADEWDEVKGLLTTDGYTPEEAVDVINTQWPDEDVSLARDLLNSRNIDDDMLDEAGIDLDTAVRENGVNQAVEKIERQLKPADVPDPSGDVNPETGIPWDDLENASTQFLELEIQKGASPVVGEGPGSNAGLLDIYTKYRSDGQNHVDAMQSAIAEAWPEEAPSDGPPDWPADVPVPEGWTADSAQLDGSDPSISNNDGDSIFYSPEEGFYLDDDPAVFYPTLDEALNRGQESDLAGEEPFGDLVEAPDPSDSETGAPGRPTPLDEEGAVLDGDLLHPAMEGTGADFRKSLAKLSDADLLASRDALETFEGGPGDSEVAYEAGIRRRAADTELERRLGKMDENGVTDEEQLDRAAQAQPEAFDRGLDDSRVMFGGPPDSWMIEKEPGADYWMLRPVNGTSRGDYGHFTTLEEAQAAQAGYTKGAVAYQALRDAVPFIWPEGLPSSEQWSNAWLTIKERLAKGDGPQMAVDAVAPSQRPAPVPANGDALDAGPGAPAVLAPDPAVSAADYLRDEFYIEEMTDGELRQELIDAGYPAREAEAAVAEAREEAGANRANDAEVINENDRDDRAFDNPNLRAMIKPGIDNGELHWSPVDEGVSWELLDESGDLWLTVDAAGVHEGDALLEAEDRGQFGGSTTGKFDSIADLDEPTRAQVTALVDARMADPNFKAGMRRTQAKTRKDLGVEEDRWTATHDDPNNLFSDGWANGIDGPQMTRENLEDRLLDFLRDGDPLPADPLTGWAGRKGQTFEAAEEDCGCDELSTTGVKSFTVRAIGAEPPTAYPQVFANWVEKTGGLPRYIKRIAKHLQARGMTQSHAIASAVNTVKKWARGGGNVKPDTVAKALAALAEWEAKKAAAKAMATTSATFAGEGRPISRPRKTSGEELVNDFGAVASAMLTVTNDVAEAVGLLVPGTRAAGGHSLINDVAVLQELGAELTKTSRRAAASLVASSGAVYAAPVAPPKAWFNDPKLKAATPVRVTPEGRIYGHLATWDSCHMESKALGTSCTRAPRSGTKYAGFHLGYVTTAEGVDVPTGRIVAGAPHADPVWSLNPTLVHYSHSGWVGADVRVGEDAYGIWIAGAVRPDVSALQLRALKASPLSGDWREDPRTGRLELVAALAVNAPGFPLPRPTALVASTGAVSSMQAVGLLAPQTVLKPGTEGAFSIEDLTYLKERAAAVRAWSVEADALAAATAERRALQAKAASYARHRKLEALAATVKEMR